MFSFRASRLYWLLPVTILAISMAPPASGSDRSTTSKASGPHAGPQVAGLIYRIISNEWQTRSTMQQYSPRIETYLQYYRPDPMLGDVPTADSYFLGRLKFSSEVINRAKEASFLPEAPVGRVLRHARMLREGLHPDEIALESLVVDERNFDSKHYAFEPVRWEYLGDVRCLAIDIHPLDPKSPGAFKGRIWVEDQNYAIVRLNGTRLNAPLLDSYVHFDCWRENLRPGVWLPVYIYSQESDRGNLRYKSQSRLWGYDLAARREQQEWTNILVDASTPVRDNTEDTPDLSPLDGQRQLAIDAERNVLDRLEKARLIAPPGPVDKVLETVVNNLIVTNHLGSLPPIHCRVMLTSTLESFSLAYTIVLSRGLIDVLPDEASLAMILAHELAHIALVQRVDAKFAFNDRLQFSDEDLLSVLDVARNPADEAGADAKGVEFLQNSPYKDKLSQVGLFLRAAVDAAPHLPHLFGPHLGNGLTEGKSKMLRMEDLVIGAPALRPLDVDQIAALPLGSRVQVNAWDGSAYFPSRKAEPLINASEKMPFRLAPTVPHLKVHFPGGKAALSARLAP